MRRAAALPEIADGKGQTALMHAAMNGHVRCMELLLSNGARPDATDKEGKTYVQHAAGVDKEALARLRDVKVKPARSSKYASQDKDEL